MSSLVVLRFSSNNSHSSNMFQSLAWFSHLSPRRSLFSGSEPRLFYMVGLSGLEPPTSRLSGVRSNRLSYKPICPASRSFAFQAVFTRLPWLVEINGFEPMTPCLQSRCSPSWAIPPYLLDPASIQLSKSSYPEGRALKIKQLLNYSLTGTCNWPWMSE